MVMDRPTELIFRPGTRVISAASSLALAFTHHCGRNGPGLGCASPNPVTLLSRTWTTVVFTWFNVNHNQSPDVSRCTYLFKSENDSYCVSCVTRWDLGELLLGSDQDLDGILLNQTFEIRRSDTHTRSQDRRSGDSGRAESVQY